MADTYRVCGKKLTKRMKQNAEITDSFLSSVLANRKIGPIALCSKCIDRRLVSPSSSPIYFCASLRYSSDIFSIFSSSSSPGSS
jgi:hypothetical protein